jgi:hypothetical protein
MRVVNRLSVLGLALAMALGMSATLHAEDAKTGTISGKVVDSEGKAVKGAKVGAVVPKADGEKPAEGARRERPTPVSTATTGEDGTYKLEKVPVGKVRVGAGAEGSGRGNVTVEVKAGEDTKADDIKLAKGGGEGGRKGGGEGGAAREGGRRRGGDGAKKDGAK